MFTDVFANILSSMAEDNLRSRYTAVCPWNKCRSPSSPLPLLGRMLAYTAIPRMRQSGLGRAPADRDPQKSNQVPACQGSSVLDRYSWFVLRRASEDKDMTRDCPSSGLRPPWSETTQFEGRRRELLALLHTTYTFGESYASTVIPSFDANPENVG